MGISPSKLLLPVFIVSSLPSSLALPTLPSTKLANNTSFNPSIVRGTPHKDAPGATAGALAANVTMRASDIVVDKLETPNVANETVFDVSVSSSTFDKAKSLPSPIANITSTNSAMLTNVLKPVYSLTPSSVKYDSIRLTGSTTHESNSSCTSTPAQNQGVCTKSTGSQWSFDLNDLVGITFGLVQTVLAVFPAMVAWQYLQGHPAAGHV
jgi:hypothetical protein